MCELNKLSNNYMILLPFTNKTKLSASSVFTLKERNAKENSIVTAKGKNRKAEFWFSGLSLVFLFLKTLERVLLTLSSKWRKMMVQAGRTTFCLIVCITDCRFFLDVSGILF